MKVKCITIIGANGTVGAQVAGLLAAFCEAEVYLISRTIEKSMAAVENAVKSVRADSIRPILIPKTYQDLEECVSHSDWVFESVAEDLAIKQDINKLIALARRPGTIVSTGTSGISVETLASVFDEEARSLYFGTHFFNPPYSLPFLEFTKTKWSDRQIAEEFFAYLETTVLRKAIHTRDRAAFLGNRIGFLFLNEVAQFAQIYKDRGGIDYMDAILGSFTGRSMAPLNTIDFVGLDIHKAILDNIHDCEPEFYSAEQILPSYIDQLILEGKLGRKAGEGLFKMEYTVDGQKRKTVYDIATASYRPVKQYEFEFANQMIVNLTDGLYQDAINCLLAERSDEAEICRYFLVKYVLCSYLNAQQVSENIADADIAMSYGFGWVPPSALCRLLGGRKGIQRLIDSDIRLQENVKQYDFSLLDQAVRTTDIDYRRYFKATR